MTTPALETAAAAHPPDPDAAIEAVNLTKTYNRRKDEPVVYALKGIDLTIPKGSFFGLLGPNGAGKSTFINILAGLVVRSGGEVRIWGYDIDRNMRAARRSIGIVPQELNIDPFFTPRELLEVQAGLYGVAPEERRTDEILELVGLTRQARAYARTLSGGMRRRLLVAKAMVHSPPILVLDEPTAGVDVELRRGLWASMRRLQERGTTILLTTHYLDEAEELCDTVAIINNGRLVACESTQALLRRLDSRELAVTVAEPVTTAPEALQRFKVSVPRPGRLEFLFPPSTVQSGEVLTAVREAGLTVLDVATREADLEDVFVRLTSQRDDDSDIERDAGRS